MFAGLIMVFVGPHVANDRALFSLVLDSVLDALVVVVVVVVVIVLVVGVVVVVVASSIIAFLLLLLSHLIMKTY